MPAFSIEELAKAYHKLINYDAKLISSDYKPDSGGTVDITGQTSEHCSTWEELTAFLRREGLENAESLLKNLLEKGFLVDVGCRGPCYRTLHMDVLYRSAHIRTAPDKEPYPLAARFKIYDNVPIPSKEDRRYGFSGHVDIAGAAKVYFGNKDVADRYIKVIRDFLRELGSEGFDIYQAKALETMLRGGDGERAYVLTAPTGSGKTLVFSLYALARVLKYKYVLGEEGRAVFIYPRKVLQVDQTGRLLRLLSLAEKHGFEVTLGLRDGDTPRERNKMRIGEEYRGLRCPRCGSPLVYTFRPKYSLKCSNDKCGAEYDFVKLTREDMGKELPDILVTNMWALETRMIDYRDDDRDIDVRFYSGVKTVVVDEAHEYMGLGGGLVSVLLKILRRLSSPIFVLSSATIPDPVGFAGKLTSMGRSSISILDFYELTEGGSNIKGRRLVIMAVLDLNPRYSWNTYVQLWSVYMAFLHYTYLASGKEYVPQAIAFINNIRELRRAHRGYEENISLGEPRDHLYSRKDGKIISPCNPFSYSHYAGDELLKNIIEELTERGRLDELRRIAGEMHSQLSPEERRHIITKLKSERGLGVVFSTSSLELGVDYDNVGFILNSGFERVISLVQRIGRGGRSFKTMRAVLGLIVTRNVPQETFYLYDLSIWERLNPAPRKISGRAPVASENTQIVRRGILTDTLVMMAEHHEETYASRTGMRSLNDVKDLLSRMKYYIHNVKGWN